MLSSYVEKALKTIEEASKAGYKGYAVQISENGFCTFNYVVFPREEKEEGADYEFVYAMNEDMEKIDKLSIGKSMYFQPCRDDKNSKGIITRIL